MDLLPTCQTILPELNQYHRLTLTDDDDKVRKATSVVLRLWPQILKIADQATDDELFELNISRSAITQVFSVALSKESLQQDHRFIREIFFACFELLSDHADIFRRAQSAFLDSNVRLIVKMLTAVVSSTQFKSTDFAREKDQDLFCAIREHVDNGNAQDELTDELMSCIWNLSDKTVLVPILLKTGYTSSVLEWVQMREKKFKEDKIDAPIHILHNLSRHDDGIDQLNRYNTLAVIGKIQVKSRTNADTDDLTLHVAMIHALLSDASEIKSDASHYPDRIVDMLIQLSVDCSKADRHRHGGSHVSEPLTVLKKIFHNDEILHHTLSKMNTKTPSMIDLLASLLTRCYPNLTADESVLENYTCVVVLNLLRLISNHQKYRTSMADHEALINVIKRAASDRVIFVDRFMPKTMESIQQAAKNILNNLSH
jgi:hypothetical protein